MFSARNCWSSGCSCAPVVAADGIKLRLLAKTCKEYIHKALVEEEAAAEADGGVVQVELV